VLLPPAGGRPRPLPAWVGLVALLGIGVLGLSTVPAAWRRSALAGDLATLRRETAAQEDHLLELGQAIRDARAGRFSRERALRRLLLAPTHR
jgi:hypothetical protein